MLTLKVSVLNSTRTADVPAFRLAYIFRMHLIGYFEGIDSERGIAWRCADSLSLRSFLGIPFHITTPDHSSLSVIRHRFKLEAHQQSSLGSWSCLPGMI